MRALKIVLLLVTFCSTSTFAAFDVYKFANDNDRHRYYKFIEELRCPKCQNNNLSGSASQIAVDLRRELHRLIDEGKNDDEIIDFMVSRYGDFVLYMPPIQKNTYLLWGLPFFLLAIGLLVVFIIVWSKRRTTAYQAPLDDSESSTFDELIQKINNKSNTKK